MIIFESTEPLGSVDFVIIILSSSTVLTNVILSILYTWFKYINSFNVQYNSFTFLWSVSLLAAARPVTAFTSPGIMVPNPPASLDTPERGFEAPEQTFHGIFGYS